MSYYSLLGYRSFKSENEIKEIVVDYNNTVLVEASSILDTTNSNLIEDDVRNKVGPTLKKITSLNVATLKIFQNKNQQTWIASANGYVFCLLDDIEVDIQKGQELIKWVAKISDINNSIDVRPSKQSPDRVGLIDFGAKHKNWYYSKRLLSDEEMAKTYVQSLILSGTTS